MQIATAGGPALGLSTLIAAALLVMVVQPSTAQNFADLAERAEPIRLPAAAERALRATYGSWTFASHTEEQIEAVRQTDPDAWPHLISGDFDVDGAADYAVLIQYDDPELGERRWDVAALMARGRRYDLYTLASRLEHLPSEAFVIRLQRKGSQLVCDGCGSEPVELDRDAIDAGHLDKPSDGVYVYYEGQFIFVGPYDLE